MPTQDELDALKARRQAIREGRNVEDKLTPDELAVLEAEDLDNAAVQESILNPEKVDLTFENGKVITLNKLSANLTRNFFGFVATVTGATLDNEQAISGRLTSNNQITGLHIKGVLAQSDILTKDLVKFIVFSSAPLGTVNHNQVPKLMDEILEYITSDDLFNAYALLCSITGASKPKKMPKNAEAQQPVPA
jgi:hypothetical protein